VEEKLASFYLGKEFDVQKGELLSAPVHYDARDLTTHAVCVGMTGSGKTGLCIDVLEEAALDGIPAIIIDPKGDVSNLLLTFPELRASDFAPWVNVDDARRKALSLEEYAQQTAQKWAEGLAQWDQSPDRIRRLQDAAEFAVYTPGSDAGLPVNVLQTLRAPEMSWDEEEEALREKVQTTVSALLGLVGIQADPVRSREHILLSNLFERAWRAGEDLDLARLITQIQDPPVRKLGVFDVDAFFPGKERFELSLALNSIIAAPSFENWLEGQPLDIGTILRRSDGKPRVSIFYIAHLSDAERMFFVSLLLTQVEAWTRRQTGTTSLRAILYFDEVFGFFPPHPASPPSKVPLLRLLKQARAFGLGVMLTTQNPVDLDYKGLTNAGTWFIGKLQTDRDKQRLLEGLEGVDLGPRADRSYFDRLISSLESRVFILHNVHASKPITFMTRWAMSYLRGPLTKRQIRELMAPRKEEGGVASPAVQEKQPIRPADQSGFSTVPTQLGQDIPQYFLLEDTPVERAVRREEERRNTSLRVESALRVYEPAIVAQATVHFQDSRKGVDASETRGELIPLPAELGSVIWGSSVVTIDPLELQRNPPADARFAELSASLGDAKRWRTLKEDFVNHLYRNARLTLLYNKALRIYSEVGEAQGRFVQRCQEEAARFAAKQREKLDAKFESRLARIEDRLDREERELRADQVEYEGRKREETLSGAESLIRLLKRRSLTTALSSGSRRRRLTEKARADVEESEKGIKDVKKEAGDLRREWDEALADLEAQAASQARDLEEVEIKPRKSDIDLAVFGLAWVPYWAVSLVDASGQPRQTRLPAYAAAEDRSSD